MNPPYNSGGNSHEMTCTVEELLGQLHLESTLEERIQVIRNNGIVKATTFVLYLPTVVLQKKHNPAFALACKLANHLDIPLVILCVALDDSHYPLFGKSANAEVPVVVATARRLSFWLQAVQVCAELWEQSSAVVWIRIHGGGWTRTPHHLTLAQQAAVTVIDELFVHPYRQFVSAVERGTMACIQVDGSIIVPPICMLH